MDDFILNLSMWPSCIDSMPVEEARGDPAESATMFFTTAYTNPLYDIFVEGLKKIVGFDHLAIHNIDQETGGEILEYCYGPTSNFDSRKCSPESPETNAVKTVDEPLITPDLVSDPGLAGHRRLLDLGFLSTAVIHLTCGGRIIGTLCLASRQIGAYGERERAILEYIADQLAPVLAKSKGGHPSGVEQEGRYLALARLTGALDGVLAGILSAEEQLRILTYAIERSPNAVVVTDAKANVEYVNPRFTEITGYPPEEVLGTPVRIAGSQSGPIEDHQQKWQAIISVGFWKMESRSHTKRGDVYWTSQSVFPLRNQFGAVTHCIVVEEDITEQKTLEEKLFLAQRMEPIGRVASGIAHDFNNLLIAMLGFTSLLQARLDPTSHNFGYASMIADLLERAGDLARQLMSTARNIATNTTETKPIDVNSVVENVVEIFSHTFDQDIQLTLELQPDPPLVNGNMGQIQQVVMNLFLNALDAMPCGGRLGVSTSSVKVGGSHSGDRLSPRPGPYVNLAVTDTGVGISDEIISRVFEPFFTTKGEKEGAGLGLWVVKEIVENQGGAIKVNRNTGGGTVFTVYLPIWAPAE